MSSSRWRGAPASSSHDSRNTRPGWKSGITRRRRTRRAARRCASPREVKDGSGGKLDPPIASSRVGSEFGLHTLFFDSPDDLIEISHRARGRDGFARGAVMAAELIRGRKGFVAV